MNTIAVDGLNEEAFRRSIESRLRQDKAGAAVEKLRSLLADYAGPGKILPERFLTIGADDLVLTGWEGLGEAVRRHDRPGRPVTALSIAFGWPGEDVPQPDAQGCLHPFVETSYYTDDAFPFSQSARDDLLEGYSYHGCTWSGDCEATDMAVAVGGIDDLHGALAALEARLLASDEPEDEEVRAGSLGACLLSALLFQAIRERVAHDGLPRPLCVLAGSNGVYPYFDAPVAGMPEEALKAAETEDESAPTDRGVPAPRYSSLLVTGIPRARKRAVLVLEESEEEMAVRIANLRGLHHRDDTGASATQGIEPEVAASPPPESPIIPAPNGPLMAKKPSGQSWDFRDMLGPRESESPAAFDSDEFRDDDDLPGDHSGGFSSEPELGRDEPSPPQPESPDTRSPSERPTPSWLEGIPPEPEQPAPDLPTPSTPRLEPVASVPRPRFPSQTAIRPGFSLLDPTLQERLDSLLAPHVSEQGPAESGQGEPFGEEPEQATAQPEATPDLGTIWPFGIGWLEGDAAAFCDDDTREGGENPSRPGLWSRLRRWLRLRG
ncbi:MAG: hypothetical protein KGM49_02065 [Sphingomonadales bacterium]|nr:hypothetical protein [Sphingomonadales bacterium]